MRTIHRNTMKKNNKNTAIKNPAKKSQKAPAKTIAKVAPKAPVAPDATSNAKHVVNNTKIHPLGDRILVREIIAPSTEHTTASGIIIPVDENRDKGSKRGEVIAVGKGRYEDGKHIPVGVEAGDTVMFQWGDKLVLDGVPETVGTDEVNYYLVRESEVLALIK